LFIARIIVCFIIQSVSADVRTPNDDVPPPSDVISKHLPSLLSLLHSRVIQRRSIDEEEEGEEEEEEKRGGGGGYGSNDMGFVTREERNGYSGGLSSGISLGTRQGEEEEEEEEEKRGRSSSGNRFVTFTRNERQFMRLVMLTWNCKTVM